MAITMAAAAQATTRITIVALLAVCCGCATAPQVGRDCSPETLKLHQTALVWVGPGLSIAQARAILATANEVVTSKYNGKDVALSGVPVVSVNALRSNSMTTVNVRVRKQVDDNGGVDFWLVERQGRWVITRIGQWNY